ncbi:Hypothetical predicted protein [Marmota monax]|uniref:TNFAIP3 interacting protein 1 n=1 Tax=Marmota monax TaxID=9995 RepID=A0A5E4DGQ6_MARMO|nr:Hypothetical predicted protein [Marmota monax]
MEGRGPYRIYDPGGSVPPGEASAAFERLVEENSRLKEKMQGIKMLGELLEESQMEASRLRQKAEELVKDSEPHPPCPSLSSFDHLTELTGEDTNTPAPPAAPACPSDKSASAPKPPSSGTSSEFEIVHTEEQNSPPESRGHIRNPMVSGRPGPLSMVYCFLCLSHLSLHERHAYHSDPLGTLESLGDTEGP